MLSTPWNARYSIGRKEAREADLEPLRCGGSKIDIAGTTPDQVSLLRVTRDVKPSVRDVVSTHAGQARVGSVGIHGNPAAYNRDALSDILWGKRRAPALCHHTAPKPFLQFSLSEMHAGTCDVDQNSAMVLSSPFDDQIDGAECTVQGACP